MVLVLLLRLLAINGPTPTAQEISALIEQNALVAQTVRVQWLVSQSSTEASREHYKAAIDHFQSVRENSQTDTERAKLDSVLDQAKRGIKYTARENEKFHQMDYWSDRSNFQNRCQLNVKLSGPIHFGSIDVIEFPDVEATNDHLAIEFDGIHIVSCGEETNDVFRVWSGRQIFDGVHSAYLTTTERRDSYGFFPPLSLPKTNWNGIPHLIDQFAVAAGSPEASVLGHVEIDGVNTLLVQGRMALPPVFKSLGRSDAIRGRLAV